MDNIADILANKDFTVPKEVTAIKTFVAKEFNQDVEVLVHNNEIIISSRSAGLISNLRLNSPSLIKVASTDKKLRFKIG